MSSQTVTFEYDAKNNILFSVDNYKIKAKQDAEQFIDLYQQQLEQIGKKVNLVSKIDGLYIEPEIDEYYGQMAKMLSQKWLLNFARYGETAVGRMGILNAATKAHFVSSIHKTRDEAVAAVLAATARNA